MQLKNKFPNSDFPVEIRSWDGDNFDQICKCLNQYNHICEIIDCLTIIVDDNYELRVGDYILIYNDNSFLYMTPEDFFEYFSDEIINLNYDKLEKME